MSNCSIVVSCYLVIVFSLFFQGTHLSEKEAQERRMILNGLVHLVLLYIMHALLGKLIVW